MPARSPVSYRSLAALLLLIMHIHGENFSCSKDGLFADYDADCEEYVKCSSGKVKGRYLCPAGRVFSEVAGACISSPSRSCIQRICATGDSFAYNTPTTACRHYYRCENGTVTDHTCPSGSWFDIDRQACSRGAGTCYEPVCAGLPDGKYPDSSNECRRLLHCRGAEVRAVESCNGVCSNNCPAPRSTAIPIPVGDADFCSDDTCDSLCDNAGDGAYADRSTGCREYFVCKSHRVISRGVCEPGFLFTGMGCESAEWNYCPSPARSPCFNRQDGRYRDWKSCSSWYDCRRGRVVSRDVCGPGKSFDGIKCVSEKSFPCTGPEFSKRCEGMPSGTYQHLESNCSQYYHCEGPLEFMFVCPVGEVYDGSKCVPKYQYLCPNLEKDSCYGRANGHYRAKDASCRAFYACINGDKAMYVCPVGNVFDGESCIPERLDLCPSKDYSCSGLSDGYHPEVDSNCRRYFFCEGHDRLATLSCLGGKIFDGHACVDRLRHECGTPRKQNTESGKHCDSDGFFAVLGTQCKNYFICVNGQKTYLSCPIDQLFNGQVCVPNNEYACPD
ncbi:unnamed protein product [Pieris macdunnoughi]|uniref:Chitin-binding type-2 domain-containing protein n=1 Tax=Pieris macdunnoughi TaxID=345717 RepID=A0A821NF30_9NEOP|nr:unnamed protein product [Pieris macdunnoughi]